MNDKYRRALDKSYFAKELWNLSRPMNALQQEIATNHEPFLMVLAARQIFGKTTVTALTEALHPMIYIPNFKVLVATDKLKTSQEFLDKVVYFWDIFKSKDWPENRLEARINNTTEFTLSNGSRILALSGEQKSPKGLTADVLVMDETAYIDDTYIQLALPTMASRPNARLIALSTPNGKQGWFYREWLKGNKKIFSTWQDCDWRSKEFFEGLKKQMTDRTFRQEFECEFLEMESAALPAELIEKAVTDEFEAWN